MDAEKIAKGLSETQRHVIVRGSFPAWQREREGSATKAALVRRGICTFTHIIAGRGDFRLTPLGFAVRDAIAREDRP